MVENSVQPSSKSKLASRPPMARNLKPCGRKGVEDLGEDLSRISDAEVAGYLNTKKESILMKMAWEMMNPDYKKGTQRNPTTVKKKVPISKTAAPPSKKTCATTTQSNAESEKKKRLSSYINLDLLDKLFDDENSPKRTKLEEPVVVGDQVKNSQQTSEEECDSEPEGSEEDEPAWNQDYSNEDANVGEDEFYGDDDLEYEDQDGGEDNEDIIW